MQLYKILKKYNTFTWLVFIKYIENIENKVDKNISKEELIFNKGLRFPLIDLVLRLSNIDTAKFSAKKTPTREEINILLSEYNEEHFKNFIPIFENRGYEIAIGLFLDEQMKVSYPLTNLLGRINLLFENFNYLIGKLTPTDLSHISLILLTIYNKENSFFYIKDVKIVVNTLKEINIFVLEENKIDDFFSHFSTNVKDYRKIAREEYNISNKTLKSYRVIYEKPIIKNLETNQFIIPSFKILVESITKLIIKKMKSEKYLNNINFGKIFEDYIKKLTSSIFDDILEFKEVDNKNKAEFFINYEDYNIVIEVKSFMFNENDISYENVKSINRKLENNIKKAFIQIEESFKRLNNAKEKIGIIVTFEKDFILSNLNNSYLRKQFKTSKTIYQNNIIILSIDEYEVLMSNSSNNVIRILNELISLEDIGQKGSVTSAISRLKDNNLKEKNQYLLNKSKFNEIEQNLQNYNA